MSMHLHHPALSLGGKKKGKVKFRNAEEAKRARELDEQWNTLQKKWGVEAEDKRRKRAMSAETLSYNLSASNTRNTKHIPSRDTGAGNAALKSSPVYTGTKMLGIGQLHKSNAVPVFSSEEAQDISKMRR